MGNSTATTVGATLGGIAGLALIAWPVAIWWEVRCMGPAYCACMQAAGGLGMNYSPGVAPRWSGRFEHLAAARVVAAVAPLPPTVSQLSLCWCLPQVRKCEKPRYTLLRTLGQRRTWWGKTVPAAEVRLGAGVMPAGLMLAAHNTSRAAQCLCAAAAAMPACMATWLPPPGLL